MDKLTPDDLVENSTLFIHPDVFLSAEQNKLILEKHITRQEIPDYFFGKDLWA
ncbi:hypothetical protein GKC33_09965 [Lactobacillus salivarius]|uniref:Uncharacterized protein n=1 Tax=Ligilactobacillus salivarius TaxID=1624 RepID=A0A6A8LRF0_9LACO|nr:hypothetical protein [Ligilactobacillus salivarius]MSE09000.1 hypothetical protein [Ligilactobacillus salivarius]